VRTPTGEVAARHIVLATGTPILDRGLTFLKVAPTRVHAVALRWPGALPQGLYLSVDGPTRSVRGVTGHDGPANEAQLVVAGGAHPVGRPGDGGEALAHWAQYHFPGAQPVSRWAAQDYRSHNLVPFAGVLPRGAGRIRFATGFGSWGLTNGPAAAQRIAAEIRGVPWRSRPAWIRVIGTRMTVPEDLRRGARENARIARVAVAGWVGAGRRRTPVPEPAEGTGVIAVRHGAPVGVSRVAGVTRAVGAVCPHLGGVVRWNEDECTWDCPLHGSRFTPAGERIEGPARGDLPRLNRAGPPRAARAR
jgi:Rieske Fe-S protein